LPLEDHVIREDMWNCQGGVAGAGRAEKKGKAQKQSTIHSE
jgi:hypothetical protein